MSVRWEVAHHLAVMASPDDDGTCTLRLVGEDDHRIQGTPADLQDLAARITRAVDALPR